MMHGEPNVTSQKDISKKYMVGFLIFSSILLRGISLPFSNRDMVFYNLPWYHTLVDMGIERALGTAFTNYTPFYSYLLALATLTHEFIPPLVAIKIIPICFDLFGALFIYKIIKLKYDWGVMPYLGGAIYFTAPTVILNSAYWGQVDSVYTSLLLVCLYFVLKEKSLQAILAFGLAFSIKAQAIFLFPFLVVLAIRKRLSWLYFGIIPIVYLITVLPVVFLGRPLLDALTVYLHQSVTFDLLSSNSPTFYFLLPSQWYSFTLLPALVIGVGFILYWIYSTGKRITILDNKYLILIAFISSVLVPFLLPKMADRYFYPADVISIALAFYWPSLWFIPVLYQLISTIAISNFLFGTNSSIVTIGFIINTIAIAVMIRTQQLAEKRNATKKNIPSVLSWLVAILMPIILFGVSLNILLMPVYIRIEYAMPHISADKYGFSKAERYKWAAKTIDYLTSIRRTPYLVGFEFQKGAPVFSVREVAFIDNLKSSLRTTLTICNLSLAATFILGMFAWAGDWFLVFVNGVKRGGWLTIGSGSILGIVLITLKGIQPHFDFQNTDTIMRLFPIRLWQDTLFYMVTSIVGGGFLLTLFSTKVKDSLGVQKQNKPVV